METKPTEKEFDTINTKFKLITEAYSILSDPGKRVQYDKLVFGESAGTSAEFEN